ncbi:2-keto-3-deoxygluconate permease [Tetragenococcus halophilus subsp. flandriensis]|uniref:2-keto-3-deoxygluconate permease n=1 Tax=Tetragenococcus halophilus TaxID=51669 RepID=UPI0023E97A91|nr:2-keto-3-deoxygluconate permease [Tetragenococcus halophilus]GMA09363.1 2-keto-3-deoxygluconate permease [Tetragenococcus halophilus subsp. flandriensis]
MKIVKTMQKVPGGMMVIPLLLGAAVNTFIPQFFEIGGFTSDLLKDGTNTIVALFITFAGSKIDLKQAGEPLYKGALLTIIKFAIGVGLGYIVNYFFGIAGFLGITPLAIICATTNSNGALYGALAGEMGDDTDVGALGLLSLNDGPFLTMIALGSTGLGNIPIMDIISVVIPLLIGMILGNLDNDFKEIMSKGMDAILPFNGFALGANMSLLAVLQAGFSGIILGLITVGFTGVLLYFIYSALRRKPDPMGMAIGTTAGHAVAVPAVIATADPSFSPFVEAASAQVAASVVISAILIPFLTGYVYRKANKTKKDPIPSEVDSTYADSTEVEDKKVRD